MASKELFKLDLHLHSQYSEDGSGTPKEIIRILQRKGLNGSAFTDHNTVKGGLKAVKDAPKGFIVIPGIEISSKDGHIIGLNVKEVVPKKLSAVETIEKIIEQGGTPIIPHVYRNMSGIKKENLKKIHNNLSAIEVFNSCSTLNTNLRMGKLAKQFNLGGTGGSDSHLPEYVGEGYTVVNSTDFSIDSIITQIEKKKTWGEGCSLSLEYRRDRMIKSINQFFTRGFKRI